MAAGNVFAPDLTKYLTTDAPPPSYIPNAAGKIPPIGYHPNEAGAYADVANLLMNAVPGGAGPKAAMAAAPLMARGFFKPAVAEHIQAAAVKLGDRIYTGATHADALESAAKVLGRSADDILSGINASGQQHELGGFLTSSGKFVNRDEATKIADAASQLRRRDELRSTQGSVSLPLDATNLQPSESSIDWLVRQLGSNK